MDFRIKAKTKFEKVTAIIYLGLFALVFSGLGAVAVWSAVSPAFQSQMTVNATVLRYEHDRPVVTYNVRTLAFTKVLPDERSYPQVGTVIPVSLEEETLVPAQNVSIGMIAFGLCFLLPGLFIGWIVFRTWKCNEGT